MAHIEYRVMWPAHVEQTRKGPRSSIMVPHLSIPSPLATRAPQRGIELTIQVTSVLSLARSFSNSRMMYPDTSTRFRLRSNRNL
jgi:hypothetical protein